MKISDKIVYWHDIANYDLQTAAVMQKGSRYLYTIFMCQQALKILFKSIYMKKFSREAPHTHNLVYLHSLLDINFSDTQNKLIADLTTYYIEGRYPTYKIKLSTLADKEKSAILLKQTEELYKWLKDTILI